MNLPYLNLISNQSFAQEKNVFWYNIKMKNKIIAHRGIHNKEIPENSLLACRLALGQNYAIEFDVHLSRDNKLVVIHDNNLKRMTGKKGSVRKLTLEEIKKHNLLKTNEKIPTLGEILDLVDGKVLLDIEIKNTFKVKKICNLVLNELEKYKGEFLLKSFNPLIVKKLKKMSNLKVGILMTKNSPNWLYNLIVKTKLFYLFRFDFIAIDKKMLSTNYYNKYVDKFPIYVWTFDSIEEANEYIKQYPKINPICNGLDM